jgi:hypothetical protein
MNLAYLRFHRTQVAFRNWVGIAHIWDALGDAIDQAARNRSHVRSFERQIIVRAPLANLTIVQPGLDLML